MKVVASVLGVSRSNLHDRLKGTTKPRRRNHKAQDAALLPLVTAVVSARPTYGYRRITAVLNWQLRAEGLARVDPKRVYRIMQAPTSCWPGTTPGGRTSPMTARS
jgi:hypothetical protein